MSTTLTRPRCRARALRPLATLTELHARTPGLTGPERLEAFASRPARVQAAMWHALRISVEAER